MEEARKTNIIVVFSDTHRKKVYPVELLRETTPDEILRDIIAKNCPGLEDLPNFDYEVNVDGVRRHEYWSIHRTPEAIKFTTQMPTPSELFEESESEGA